MNQGPNLSRELLRIGMTDDGIPLLLRLDPTILHEELESLSSDQLHSLAGKAFDVLGELLDPEFDLQRLTSETADLDFENGVPTEIELRDRVAASLVWTLDLCAWRLLGASRRLVPAKDVPRGVRLSEARQLRSLALKALGADQPKDPTDEELEAKFSTITQEVLDAALADPVSPLTWLLYLEAYLRTMVFLYTLRIHRSLRIPPVGDFAVPYAMFDVFLYQSLQQTYRLSELPGSQSERNLRTYLLSGLLDRLRDTYSHVPAWATRPIDPLVDIAGVSHARLVGLAERSAAAKRAYGASQIAKRFEEHLSLLFQSFGFYVVTAKTGQSTVDLICHAAGVADETCFLIEAKTRKGRYPFSRADQRALEQYVQDVRRGLHLLPKPTLVLLVGPAPASTVDEKLTAFETCHGVPIRYMTARQLVTLRGGLSGPLDAKTFEVQLKAGGHVVDDVTVDLIVSTHRKRETVHEESVRQTLGAFGV